MINLTKLSNVVHKDGKIEAQCPACAASGADATGNHLVIFPDGKFGCVANARDKEHNKQILKLVGAGTFTPPQLTVSRIVIPESTVLMKIGRIGQKRPAPAPAREDQCKATQYQPKAATSSPAGPAANEVENFPPPPPGGWKTIESISTDDGQWSGAITRYEVVDFLYGDSTGTEVAK